MVVKFFVFRDFKRRENRGVEVKYRIWMDDDLTSQAIGLNDNVAGPSTAQTGEAAIPVSGRNVFDSDNRQNTFHVKFAKKPGARFGIDMSMGW